jgi:hypothetical protein
LYGWVWRHLPGAAWVKALGMLLLFALTVFVLFQFVFPWAEPRLPFDNNGSLNQ